MFLVSKVGNLSCKNIHSPLPSTMALNEAIFILKVLVIQLRPTLCDPMDCSPPGFSVHGVLQARILEWVAISFSRGSSQPSDQTCIPASLFSNDLALHIRWTNIGAAAWASVLRMHSQCWSSLGLTGLISLLFKGLSRVHKTELYALTKIYVSNYVFIYT